MTLRHLARERSGPILIRHELAWDYHSVVKQMRKKSHHFYPTEVECDSCDAAESLSNSISEQTQRPDVNINYNCLQSPHTRWCKLCIWKSMQYHHASLNSVHYTKPAASRKIDWVRLNVPPTHYRSYRGRVFTGQMTQPTVSKHWRNTQTKANQKTSQCILTKEYR